MDQAPSFTHSAELYELLQTLGPQGLVQEVLERQLPADAFCSLNELLVFCYWKKKDLASVRQVAEHALHAGRKLALLQVESDPVALLTALKPIAYNLGSFSWPGWAEPGITIREEDLFAGRTATLLNLQLALQLDCGNLACSRAYWLSGAHHLALKSIPEAIDDFIHATQYAELAETPEETLLSAGFECLSRLAAGEIDAAGRLEEIKAELRGIEDGDLYIHQIETAAKVFL